MTQEQFKELFKFYEEDGYFVRLKWSRGGNPISMQTIDDWPMISIKGKKYMAAKLAWLYHYGVMPRKLILPINGDYKDLRISNLYMSVRNTTRGRAYVKSKTGEKSIYLNDQLKNPSYSVIVHLNCERIQVGTFKTLELAINARNKYMTEHAIKVLK